MPVRSWDVLPATAALAVAHPSHELRVHGWLQRARPRVFILTDGGGHAGESRLPRSSAIVDGAGATPGEIFGPLGEAGVYKALLCGHARLFTGLAEDLATAFVQNGITLVVGDAAEGYSSTHDVWRLVVNSAVRLAGRRSQHRVENYEFLVIGPPTHVPEGVDEVREIQLDDHEYDRKIAAARTYTSKLAHDVEIALGGGKFFGVRRFSEPQLAGEADGALIEQLRARFESDPRFGASVRALLSGIELEAFRTECFWRAQEVAPAAVDVQPFYEVYGEKLVESGRYPAVIRHNEHVLPIAQALAALE